MRPRIWSEENRWYVSTPPKSDTDPWWKWRTWPHTAPVGYDSLGEAMDATLHALTVT